jgi:hypothetical protein
MRGWNAGLAGAAVLWEAKFGRYVVIPNQQVAIVVELIFRDRRAQHFDCLLARGMQARSVIGIDYEEVCIAGIPALV